MVPNESPYMIPYMSVMQNEVSISRSFRDIYENEIFDLWPWTKVKGHGTKWKPIYRGTDFPFLPVNR